MDKKIILKSIGGFYYVKTNEGVIECKAKGKFRNMSLSPVAGDFVETEFDGSTNIISKIYDRKNKFLRPPFANLDLLVMVISVIDPAPNYLVIDKMCAIARYKNVDIAIVITKTDLADYENVANIYKKAGFPVFISNKNNPGDLSKLMDYMKGKTVAFSGNSGAGKSTLLNMLFPHLQLATNETSKKLGRGKHTTRAVTIYDEDGCLVADTPGFSSIELDYDNFISKDDLANTFIEFRPFLDNCKFRDCAHIGEKGCAVCKAVSDGIIPKSRLDSYITMYERQKNIKEWDLK